VDVGCFWLFYELESGQQTLPSRLGLKIGQEDGQEEATDKINEYLPYNASSLSSLYPTN